MPTLQDFWRPIINSFNPLEQVRVEDVARFFVDRNENDPARSLISAWKLECQLSIGQPTPYSALLTGHHGSGKSSELLRLGYELVDDFFVVWFDAESSLWPETANHFDIVLAMGLAVHAAAQQADLQPDSRLLEALIKSLAKLVRRVEERKGYRLDAGQLLRQVFAVALVTSAVAVGGLPAALPAGAFLYGAEKVAKTARVELNVQDSHVRELSSSPNRAEVLGTLNAIISDVERKAKKPLLILVDGLDKVPQGRADLIFLKNDLLAAPACVLVYAAPIEFSYRPSGERKPKDLFGAQKMLPNPPVHLRPPTGTDWRALRQPNKAGLNVMRKVATKRIEANGRTTEEVIVPEALNLLACMSGGVMREFVRYLHEAARDALLQKRGQIDLAIAQDVVDRQRQELAIELDLQHREVLRAVLERGFLIGRQREVEEALLRGNYLLAYGDHGESAWFDAHPNVLPLL